jgi:hypothetical protein
VENGGRQVWVKLQRDNSFPVSHSGPAVLVVGGAGAARSVEAWTPGGELNCSLPSLPQDMVQLTVDMVEGRATACNEKGCLKLGGAGWVGGPSMLEERQLHTSAVLPDGGLLLVGGEGSPSTTEIISPQGVSVAGFTLSPLRWKHCSTQTDPGTIVLTGGIPRHEAGKSVKEYSEIKGQDATVRELPDLNNGRYLHACGMYTVGDRLT